MLAFLFVTAAVLGGAALTFVFEEDASLTWRLAFGASVGLTAASLCAYVLASVLGLTPIAVWLATAAALAPLVLLRRPALRARLVASMRALATRPVALAGIAVTGIFAVVVCGRAFYVTPGGISVGDVHNFGDLTFHLAITCDFLFGQRFPPEHPSLGGASLTYPFLTDFGAGVLAVGGLPLDQAYQVQSSILLLALLVLIHAWFLELTDNGLAATLGVVMFVCSGGLGWFAFVGEVWSGERGMFPLLGDLPRDYTISSTPAEGLRWGNMITTLLIPQRTLVVGLGLAVTVFTLWWRALRSGDQAGVNRRMTAAGCVAGLLPLAHAHSYLVVMGVGACLALLFSVLHVAAEPSDPPRPGMGAWGRFAVAALAIGLPQIALAMRGARLQTEGFIGWKPGWDKPDEMSFVMFWLRNTGLLIPLTAVSLIARDEERPVVPRALRFYCAPFFLCFVVANLLRLAPWVWDNIKVLVYAFLAALPLVGLMVAGLLRQRGVSRVVGAALFVALVLSGLLDVWRVTSGQVDQPVIDRSGVLFAEQVRGVTPPGALILHAAVPNHPLVLSGRRHFLGYPGHVWSQGLPPGTREEDIKQAYAGGPAAVEMLRSQHVEYIAVGPQERGAVSVNDAFLASMPVVLNVGPYSLHQVKITQ